jgi:hypothetical protein
VSDQVRTYGGWRERRGFGVAGLSGRQTFLGLGVVTTALCVAMVWPSAVVPLALAVLCTAAVGAVRVRGESLGGVVMRHGRWMAVRRRGRTVYRSDASPSLPGALSTVRLVEILDAADRPLAVLQDSRSGTLTAVVPVEPVGIALVPEDQTRQWMTVWGDWLAHLGYSDRLRHVVVTVDTRPRLPAHRGAGDDDPALPVAVLDALCRAGGTISQTLVSLTIGASEDLAADCAVLVDLVGSVSALGGCGVTVRPAMDASQVSRWVRQAFDPHLPGDAAGMDPDIRPTATLEMWDHYRHDSAVSAGFVWCEPPGQVADPSILLRLFGPADYGKRVSLVFEPVPAHTASREVDQQAEAALFRREYRKRLGRDETARDRVDLELARRTATEQARGAGVVDVGLYTVVTADDPEALRAASADLENRAGEARLRLRRNYGAQSATFFCTLGLGYVPPRGW